MGRRASNNRAQRNDAVIRSAGGHFLGGQRNLEGSGYAGNMDILFIGAMPDKGVNGAFKGVVVPQGPAKVVFSYGSAGGRMLNMVLMLLFYGMAGVLLFSVWRRRDAIVAGRG